MKTGMGDFFVEREATKREGRRQRLGHLEKSLQHTSVAAPSGETLLSCIESILEVSAQ